MKNFLHKSLAIVLVIVMLLSVITVAVPVLAQAQETTCSKCFGQGWYYCKTCYGDGWVICSYCGGGGRRYGVSGYSTCLWCSGRGTRPCNTCMRQGTIRCENCKGSGSIDDGTSFAKLEAVVNGFIVKWLERSTKYYSVRVEYSTKSDFIPAYHKDIYTGNGTASATISNLEPNTKYYVRFLTEYSNNCFEKRSAVLTVVTKESVAPLSTQINKLTALEAGFEVVWDRKTKNVNGYQIQYATDNAFTANMVEKIVEDNSNTSLKITALKEKETYYVRVRTYKDDGGKDYSSWSSVESVVTKETPKPSDSSSQKTTTVPQPKATSLAKLTAKPAGFTVSWKKQTKNTTGYQIQYATNSKFTSNKATKTVKGNGKTSLSVSGLKAQKKYFVRVRTYKSANGKTYYSSWSKASAVVTKKAVNLPKPAATALTNLTAKPAGFAVSWKKQTRNVTGYQIQYATDSKFTTNKGIKTVKGSGKTSLTVSGLKASQKYFVRIRTYKSAEGASRYSAWSKAKSIVPKSAAPKATKIKKIEKCTSVEVYVYFDYVKNCSGYQLQVSQHKNFQAGADTALYTCNENWGIEDMFDKNGWLWVLFEDGSYAENWFANDTTLENGKTYYFRMRTLNKIGGNTYYSKWSNVATYNN